VGRGTSTWLAGAALDRNIAEGHPGEIVSIDPYFRGDNSTSCMRLVRSELQHIAPSEREALLRSDIFFVDSSHIAKWGSDVLQVFETWIPNVAPNTLVHIHDIFTPYDYPLYWIVKEKRFWNEQYLLESFMAYNSAFRIDCPMWYLYKAGSLKKLAEQFGAPQLAEGRGGAFWISRVQPAA
jgi:hypothetical protein